ncbi:unnamed protein product [Amaranthus hypochondriacus]
MSRGNEVIVPHCQQKCGNIDIPWPFGIGDGCFFKENNNITDFPFEIHCYQSSTSPPTPILGTNLDIENISILEGELRIKLVDVSYKCYNKSGYDIDNLWQSLNMNSFTISSAKNNLIAIGCDTYAWFTGFRHNKMYGTACLTKCIELNDAIDGECSGIGCCQSSLPTGVKNITVKAYSFTNHISVYSFNPCSAAFPVAKDAFTFYKSNLTQNFSADHRKMLPVVLNWSIGLQNCSKAKEDGSCLCKQNAECYDMEYESGYRCKCKHGYGGNPYMPRGCTDIDECKQENDCEKAAYCYNTAGSYYCKCPKGHHGDGTTSSSCISNKKHWLAPVLVAAVLGIVLGSIILFIFGWWLNSLRKRRQLIKQRAQYFERNGGLLLQQQMSSDDGGIDRIKIFTIEELEKATDNFNKHRILGKGGNGTVYKGMLDEGKIVAVKKSNMVNENQHEFINEVLILSQINHRNIVKLFGCSLEAEVPLLVYEFIPNGTLYHHIHDPSQEFPLTWKMRLQIASDSATALVYLHSLSSALIYHRDIKSSNILLDNKYRATLSDFGSSRSLAIDQTRVFTRVMGTFGYIDPEYFHSQQYTEKSDVYSFGVVLVELLTGQKAIRGEALEFERSLTSWFLSYWNGSNVLDIVDSRILEEGVETEFDAIAKLAKQCLNLDGKNRPTMKEVLVEIEVVLSVHVPKKLDRKMPQFDRNIRQRATYLNTFNLESSSSNSAELSLLFNPR